MNKLNYIKRVLLALIMCLSLSLGGCGNSNQTEEMDGTSSVEIEQNEEVSAEEVVIDYGDAESFEATLNDGKNLEGKVVQFVAGELHPDSSVGYNVWAGEHLNFVSSRNPDIQENDTVTVRATTIESYMGSWIINYEKVDNAVIGKNTITYKESENATKENEEITKATESSSSNKFDTENYEHNECYDVVETSIFTNSIGDTFLIHKVLAKKNISIDATVLAYAEDGSVIGKKL